MESFQFDSNQILSLVGAVLVLAAFMSLNFKRMNPDGLLYAALNFVGTGLLAASVWNPFNLGLFLVEAVWSATSLWLCVRVWRRQRNQLK